MKKTFTIICSLLFVAVSGLKAQSIKTPAPSPLQTLKQAFALSELTIEYSRPSAKGRVVFGDLVPYDKIWRTGANQSTKITFGEEVKIAGSRAEKTLVISKYLMMKNIDFIRVHDVSEHFNLR